MNLEEQVLAIMREVFETDDVSTQSSQKNCERWDSLHHLTRLLTSNWSLRKSVL